MYLKIKDPEKRIFLISLLIALAVLVALGTLAGKVISQAGTAGLWEMVKNGFKAMWHEKPSLFIPLGVMAVAMLVGLFSLPSLLLRKFKKWTNPKRIRALHFAREGVYVISDVKILLPYEETSLKLLVHINSRLNSKSRRRTAYIGHIKLVLTCGDCSYTAVHVPDKDVIYRLADMHAYFPDFAYDTTLEHRDFREEEALSKHILAQIENQMRYGLHCKYAHRTYLLVVAVILDLVACYLLAMDFISRGQALFSGAPAVVLFGVSAILLVLWAKDYATAQKIKRMSGRK